MKQLNKFLVFLVLSAVTFTGCDNVLDVDSDRYVFEDQYPMTATNDSLYSLFGAFSKLQKLADTYVLVGELRGDLMDVTDNSSRYLKELNSLEYSSTNPYTNNLSDYYAVINNCNYIIQHVDTTIQKNGKPVMKKIYAVAKGIRAWTYMQVALNYGKCTYYTEPILTVKQSQKQYPVYTMEELAPVLIADLEPWKDEEYPEIEMNDCFYPIRFLLGDLHLWLGEYEQAATEYHDLMYDKKYTVSDNYRSYRKVLNNAFTQSFVINWNECFSLGSNECITYIPASNQYERHFTLDSLVLDYKIAASQLAIDNWNAQVYYYSSTLDTLGDLRIDGSVLALKKGYSFSDTYGNNITNNSST
ncbi:MAG: RagB/SusD family nutrient uptake outer membrane protein, partial [Bacteroidota bacterium]|nr:RagB/SusD family nutrient uptake outer membrane protein [Bacteroidota bacterium]